MGRWYKKTECSSSVRGHSAIADGTIDCSFGQLWLSWLVCWWSWPPNAHNWGAEWGESEPAAKPVDCLAVGLVVFDCNHWCQLLVHHFGSGTHPTGDWENEGWKSICAPLLLYIGQGPSSFLAHVISVAGGEWEWTIGVSEEIKNPNIEKCTRSVIFLESLCLDVNTSSILSVCSAVV